MLRKSLFLIFFILQNSLLFSQNNSLYDFKRVSISDIGVELLTRQTWDENGNLWGVTEKGLVKYNGYSSNFFVHDSLNPNSLVSNRISLFEIVDNNEFWITYADTTALTKFNPITEEFKHYFPDSTKENSLPFYQITKVFKDSKNRIWLPTWGDGLFKLNEENGLCEKYKFPIAGDTVELPSFVKDIDELSDGRFLISFFSEFYGKRSWPVYFNPDNETYEQLNIKSLVPLSLSDGQRTTLEISMMIVHFAYEDVYKNIWFGTYSGLVHYDTKKK